MLAGPRVRLVPVPRPVAVAVCDGADADPSLAAAALRAAPGWPHAGSADALRPVAEQPEQDGPAGVFLVLDEDDAVVGDAGLAGPVDPDGDLEIAYGLAEPARGRGLGTEAVTLLLAWAERQDGVRRVVARVLPGNEASARLLARVGFARQGADPHDPRHVLWVRGRGGRSGLRLAGRHVC